MSIEFDCSSCYQKLRVPTSARGKKSKCPSCSTIQVVPETDEEEAIITDVFVIEDSDSSQSTANGKLKTRCPKCKSALEFAPELKGTRGLCKACQNIFTIIAGQAAKDESNTFPFECPDCGQLFEGTPGMEGKKGRCTGCKKVFDIVAKAPTRPQVKPAPPLPNPVAPKPVQRVQVGKPVVVRPVDEFHSLDWSQHIPPAATSSQSSLSYHDQNPYAAANSYSASQPTFSSNFQGLAAVNAGSAESIRERCLNHEGAIRIIGFLYCMSAVLGGIVCVLWLVQGLLVVAGSPLFVSRGKEVAEFPGAFLIALSLVGILFSALGGWVGWGLRSLDPAARIGAIVYSALGLLGFPCGTIVHAYFLYLYLSEKGIYIFSPEYKRVIEATPHMRYRSIVINIFLGLLAFMFALVIVALLMSMVTRR